MKVYLIMIFLIFLTIFTNCNSVEFENDSNLNLELEKYSLSKSDSLKGVLKVTNYSDETVIYKFNSGCQFGIEIKKIKIR
ncbi:MAG: hypothetical protein IPH62_00865 [Ignavibacteriae bacterium]|nr:hypothetical protein [Ignavibacteriota bacterium]